MNGFLFRGGRGRARVVFVVVSDAVVINVLCPHATGMRACVSIDCADCRWLTTCLVWVVRGRASGAAGVFRMQCTWAAGC